MRTGQSRYDDGEILSVPAVRKDGDQVSVDHVNGNVDRAELRQHRFGDQGTPFSCREIGCDVMHPLGRHRWQRTSGGGDACTRIPKDFNDSRTDTPCPARNERAAVRELEIKAHGTISRKAIFLRSSRKKNRRSIGLPGKFPVSRLVTTVMPSRCSAANGSLV